MSLLDAARALRAAQRNYIADQGNEGKGKDVALAAAVLDTAISRAELASLSCGAGPGVAEVCEMLAPSADSPSNVPTKDLFEVLAWLKDEEEAMKQIAVATNDKRATRAAKNIPLTAQLLRALMLAPSSASPLFSDDQRKALNNLAERLRNAMLFIEEWSNWWSYALGVDDNKPMPPEETAAAEKMAESLGARARDMVIDNRRALANVSALAPSASAPSVHLKVGDGCLWLHWPEGFINLTHLVGTESIGARRDIAHATRAAADSRTEMK